MKKFGNERKLQIHRVAAGRKTYVTDSNWERANVLIQGSRRIVAHNFADALKVSYGSAKEIIADFGCHKILSQPPYSPDSAPFEFDLFGPMKGNLCDFRFYDLDVVKSYLN